jgi:hypothetical protein
VSSEIRRLVWTFDVDGCLVDSLTGTSLRPGATVNLPPQHQPDVFVDDWPDEAPVTARLVAVSPYIAPNPHDRGLAPLLAELMAKRS